MKLPVPLQNSIFCLVGIILGFLLHEYKNNLFRGNESIKKELAVAPGLDKIMSEIPEVKVGKAGTDGQLATAHDYSKNFRKAANFCPDSMGKYNINPATLGFMDIDFDNLSDLFTTASTIRKLFAASNQPRTFRIINGLKYDPAYPMEVDKAKKILMVVPLDPTVTNPEKNKEITEYGGKTLIRILDYKIDCPIKCDYANSTIILYPNATLTENACK